MQLILRGLVQLRRRLMPCLFQGVTHYFQRYSWLTQWWTLTVQNTLITIWKINILLPLESLWDLSLELLWATMLLILIHLFGLSRVTKSIGVPSTKKNLLVIRWQWALGGRMLCIGLLNRMNSFTMIELYRKYPRFSPLLVALLGLALPFSSSSTTIPTFLLRFLSVHPSSRRKRKNLICALVLTRIKITKGSLDRENQLNHQVNRLILMNHLKSWQAIFSTL